MTHTASLRCRRLIAGAAPLLGDLAPRSRVRLGALLGAAFATIAALAALTLAGVDVPRPAAAAAIVTCCAVAATLAIARAIAVRVDRVAWCLIAGGLVTWLVSVLWLTFRPPVSGAPGITDGLWLVMYAFYYGGLVALIRPRARNCPPSVAVDGVIGSLGVATAATTLLAPSVLASRGAPALTIMTAIAYPLSEALLLVVVLVVFALDGWRPGRMWLLFGAAAAIAVVADSVDAVLVTGGAAPHKGVPVPFDSIAQLLVALGALQRPNPLRRLDFAGGRVVVVPLVFATVSGVVLVDAAFSDLPSLTILLAAATLAASVGRLARTVRDVDGVAVLRREAGVDDLTGLANRRAFRRRLGDALANRRSARGAVLLLDLDRFKDLNDTLGHGAGDELLRRVGGRVVAAIRTDDVAGRLGGDEFAVVCPRADADAATAVAARITALLALPVDCDAIRVHVDASIGIALWPAHGSDADLLLQHADSAMYRAKRSAATVCVYADDHDEHSRERLALEGELRSAIGNGEIVVHYQPQIDLASGVCDAVEALVRWQHPTRGLLPPAAFLPVVERSGLARALTHTVLDQALTQAAAFAGRGHDVRVSVNLFAPILLDADLPDVVAVALAHAGVDGDRLCLEITESAPVTEPARAIAALERLAALGVTISLDDFGTGYSSLGSLRRLCIGELKIDRSFVSGITGAEDEAIVHATIGLAHSLGLRVVAEGVETDAQRLRLRALGCDALQGFLYSRPLPADVVTRWVAEFNRAEAAA